MPASRSCRPCPIGESARASGFREGGLEVFDFDPYSQALSKLERGFELDLEDVQSMLRSGRVEPLAAKG